MLLTSREKQNIQSTNKDFPSVGLDWTNLFLPPLSERNRSHWFGVSLPSSVSLLRVENVQMNTFSVCMETLPPSSESPGDSIDDDEEESPRLSLLSSSSPLILLYSWHIRTWLLTQRAGLIMSRLQQNHLKKTG